MILPAIPLNLGTFIILSGLFSLTGFQFGKCYTARYSRLSFSLLFGFIASFATMALITAIGFIPDDWSANRLTWPGGLFYGYKLYSGETGPSNGYFYPPLGAWFYLPAAGMGILLRSPAAALLIGWMMSMMCMISPILLLLYRLGRNDEKLVPTRLLTLLIATCIILSSPQLRYVATMIHVDAPTLLFLGLAVVLLLPINFNRNSASRIRFFAAGCCVALSAFSKQSVWPLLPGIIVTAVILNNRKAGLCMLFSALITGAACFLVMICLENGSEAFRMIWLLPLHQLIVTKALFALKLLLRVNLPIFALIGLTLFGMKIYPHAVEPPLKKCFSALLLMSLWMVPFAILTRMRLGADWNHLAIPSYLALLGCVTLLPTLLSRLFNVFPIYSSLSIISGITALIALPITPYLARSCGWYLWIHNSHQQAFSYEAKWPQKAYFPWQVFSMLIAEGKLYHLDDCLRYEVGAGWYRSEDSIEKYLPQAPFRIAIRPFGAESYLVQKKRYELTDPDPFLENWKVYQKKH